ncbi:hypothetical protein ACFQZU_14995, partial [Streptomonospora algeriensis]
PQWDAWDTRRWREQRPSPQHHDETPTQSFAQAAEAANPRASQSDPAESGWANGANGQPHQAGPFEDSRPQSARAEAGRQEWNEPENREGYGAAAYLSRRYGGAGQDTVVPPSPESGSETLPIFDAIESNWFRRRSGGPATEPETGPLPRFGADSAAGAEGDRGRSEQAQQGSPADQAPRYGAETADAGGSSGRQGDQYMQQDQGAPGARQPHDSPAPAAPQPYGTEDDWRSEADRGWEAARTAAEPMAGGLTTSGLPKRVPKANLVPGTAPEPENVKQVPSRSADRVRNRFSGFQRGIQEGRSQIGGNDEEN